MNRVAGSEVTTKPPFVEADGKTIPVEPESSKTIKDETGAVDAFTRMLPSVIDPLTVDASVTGKVNCRVVGPVCWPETTDAGAPGKPLMVATASVELLDVPVSSVFEIGTLVATVKVMLAELVVPVQPEIETVGSCSVRPSARK